MLDCPKKAIVLKDKKAVIGEECVECGVCLKVCPVGAPGFENKIIPGVITCNACPIKCQIPPDKTGACQRLFNKNGKLERSLQLHFLEDVKDIVGIYPEPLIQKPVLTGIGAGTTYPDYRPAPFSPLKIMLTLWGVLVVPKK